MVSAIRQALATLQDVDSGHEKCISPLLHALRETFRLPATPLDHYFKQHAIVLLHSPKRSCTSRGMHEGVPVTSPYYWAALHASKPSTRAVSAFTRQHLAVATG